MSVGRWVAGVIIMCRLAARTRLLACVERGRTLLLRVLFGAHLAL